MRAVRSVTLALAVAGATVTALGTAHADPAVADRAIADAESLARAGKLVEAAARFEDAYAADPRPELICDVGVAYNKAQDWSRAQLYLGKCLDRGSVLDAKFIDAVRSTLATVEATLRAGDFTPVDISVTPAGALVHVAEFGPDETIAAPRVVWLPAGHHRLVASAEGYVDSVSELDLAGHDVKPVAFKLLHPGEVPKPAPASPAPSPPPSPISAHVPASDSAPSKLPAIGATVATVGLGLIALSASSHAHSAADHAAFALSDDAYAADSASVSHWNDVTAISGIAALVGAAASGFLWYRAFHDTHVEVTPTRGGGAVTFSGHFSL